MRSFYGFIPTVGYSNPGVRGLDSVPSSIDWAATGSMIVAVAALLGLGGSIVGFVFARLANSRAKDAEEKAGNALDKSADASGRAADALERANSLVEIAGRATPWAYQFIDRRRFLVVNTSGLFASEIVMHQVHGIAGSFGVNTESGDSAGPGEALLCTWHFDATSPPMLAVEIEWTEAGTGIARKYLLHVDRRPQREAIAQFDAALVDVMRALKQRHDEIVAWKTSQSSVVLRSDNGQTVMVGPGEQPGGPSNSNLQTFVDIAMMRAPSDYDAEVQALAAATFDMQLGRTDWQARVVGEFVGDIRKWRTYEITGEQFIAAMEKKRATAQRHTEVFDERYNA